MITTLALSVLLALALPSPAAAQDLPDYEDLDADPEEDDKSRKRRKKDKGDDEELPEYAPDPDLLGDPDQPGAADDLPDEPEDAGAPADDRPGEDDLDGLEDLPDGDDIPQVELTLSEIPEEAPAPDGGLLNIAIDIEVAEMRLKGPDGKYYTPGRLKAGRYVLGIRFYEKEDWETFTFDLEEGKEMRIDCAASTKACHTKTRTWRP
jgi:hypothetical protein